MDENLTGSDEKSKTTDDTPKSGVDKRQENLRPPWKPGESGNVNGKPKGAISLVALMRKLAAAEARGADEAKEKIREVYGEDVAEKITNGHLYIAKVHQAAMNGEEWAIKVYLNYLDGMPVQAVNLGGQSGNPIDVSDSAMIDLIKQFKQEREQNKPDSPEPEKQEPKQ